MRTDDDRRMLDARAPKGRRRALAEWLGEQLLEARRRRRTGRSARACSPCPPITSCATRWTSSAVTASRPARTSSGSVASPSSTSRRRPNMTSPCGLSVCSTNRPFATLRAFSSSSAGTGSSAIFRSSATIVVIASSMRVDVDARLREERAGVGVAVVDGVDVVGEAAPLAHLGEEPRRHARAEHGREQLKRVAVGMGERVAGHAEAEMRLVGVLRVDLDAGGPVGRRARRAPARRSPPARGRRAARSISASRSPSILPPTPTTMRVGLVPVVDVAEERVAGRGADRLLAADDVPAERLVAVEKLVVDAADVVARRVEVHVHLLDDHALLAVDLLRRRTSSAGACRRGRRARSTRCSPAHRT